MMTRKPPVLTLSVIMSKCPPNTEPVRIMIKSKNYSSSSRSVREANLHWLRARAAKPSTTSPTKARRSFPHVDLIY